MDNSCQDNDPNCNHCFGHCTRDGYGQLERIDMDSGPIPFCEPCGDDALGSGVFRIVGDVVLVKSALPIAVADDELAGVMADLSRMPEGTEAFEQA